jgi:hypothetical protein
MDNGTPSTFSVFCYPREALTDSCLLLEASVQCAANQLSPIFVTALNERSPPMGLFSRSALLPPPRGILSLRPVKPK